MTRTHWLSGSALLAITLASMPALAQTAPADSAAAEDDVGEIIVYGQGESRQVQVVSGQKIEIDVAGVSPLKVLQQLPSVNFQSADPFGAYEWSTRITIRGFNQNQLGFTLDGVPLGDMTYGNHNGLHISRAIISDNVAETIVAQGTGALGTASSSNLGGTLQFRSRAPEEKFGARASASLGSNATVRFFGRIDTGTLPTGTRAFISAAYSDAEKWKGDGLQRHTHVNAQVQQDIGPATFTAFVNYSDRVENDYHDLSLEMIQRLGLDWDNFAPNWPLAVRVAQIAANRGDTFTPATPYPNVGRDYPFPIRTADDAYFDASGLRTDWLYGGRLEVPLGALNLKLTGYGHNNEGQGIWFTPYQVSPSGMPISVRTTEYDIDRFGVTGSGVYEWERFTFEAGFWFEQNDFFQARRFYGLDNTTTGPSRSSTEFQRDPFRTQWSYDFDSQTRQLFAGVTYRGDGFSVNAGTKALRVRNKVTPVAGDRLIAFPADGIVANKDFLPQVGFTYDVLENYQVFGSFSKNMRAFIASATSGPFATTAAGFAGIRNTLKPETTTTFELGVRFNLDQLRGVLAIYNVDFKDRLLGVSSGPGIVGSPVVLQNVGDVRSRGFESGLTWTYGMLTFSGSYSYNDNTYRDDVVDGAGRVVAAIKGKTVVDSPKHLLKGAVSFDTPILFGQIDANYLSSRFFTFTNDQKVGSQFLVNLSAGYRIGEHLKLPVDATIQLNVTNLLKEKYVSTIGSNGFGNRGDNQTLLAGSPRQFFVSLRSSF
jgi:iron complex outermembrane receptor protein